MACACTDATWLVADDWLLVALSNYLEHLVVTPVLKRIFILSREFACGFMLQTLHYVASILPGVLLHSG